MSNADTRGRFVWHELMTTDPDAAGEFYSKVVPWTAQPSGMPSYSLWMSGKAQVGGLMALPDGDTSGTPPHWIIYIATPDVDATVETAQKLGGKVLKGASDIPNVGRFAVLSDPQGAAFAAFAPTSGSADGRGESGGIGDFTWHELATTDLDSALEFYVELFGWTKGATHDMGPLGLYQIISHGGQEVGGIYKVPDASTPPNWLSYVRVADVAKASAAAKAAGGRVLHGPVEVPGGSWIVMLLDPQGGAFAVVEPAKAAAAKPSKSKKAPPPKASAPKAAPTPTAALTPAPAKVAAKKAAKKAGKKVAGKKAAAKKAPAGKTPAKKPAPAKKSTLAKKPAAAKRKAAAKKAVRKAPVKRAAAKKGAKGKARKKR